MSLTTVQILYILLGIAIVATVAVGGYYLKVNFLNPSGKGAEKAIARQLSKFAVLRGFKVKSHVRFSYRGDVYYVENMLIGYFGILFVHTLGGTGEYYGKMEGKTWSRVFRQQKYTFPNPLAEQQKAMAALRAVLSKNRIFNIPMDGIAVLTSRSNKTALHITNGGEILLPGKLKGYLDKTKFEKDAGVDVMRIVKLLETCQAELEHPDSAAPADPNPET